MDATANDHAAAGIKDRQRQRLESERIRPVRKGWRWNLPACAAICVIGALVGNGVSFGLAQLAIWLDGDLTYWQSWWWRWYFLAGEPLIIAVVVVVGSYLWFRYAYSRPDADAVGQPHGDAGRLADGINDAGSLADPDSVPDADAHAIGNTCRNPHGDA